MQCEVFFSQHPHIKLVESIDTAETAHRIQKHNLKGIAAVAAPIAAQMYDLEILAAGIHTIKSNKTRFVALCICHYNFCCTHCAAGNKKKEHVCYIEFGKKINALFLRNLTSYLSLVMIFYQKTAYKNHSNNY